MNSCLVYKVGESNLLLAQIDPIIRNNSVIILTMFIINIKTNLIIIKLYL